MSDNKTHRPTERDEQIREAAKQALVELGMNDTVYDGTTRRLDSVRWVVFFREANGNNFSIEILLAELSTELITIERIKLYLMRKLEEHGQMAITM